ncbi:ciliary BBSome complex subunit 1 domain-containing protein [Ditylenchus destructor]|uniref:Ciliary BBSome complex subunit 1 domain-containing protein n=1 Tax=Ditylenchus destructor TaxID=166010 RepID=A0AAD4RD71_9BILA|nr:ciliary BBSome complex subunit 1 domain-containing protein [Ditylenchus destructor]
MPDANESSCSNKVNNQHKWTRALWEPNAGVECNKSCVALSDVQGNNDHHLLLVDEGIEPNRLKLFKGLKQIAESVLSENPSSIVTFISDAGQTNTPTPCLAVACGSSLLIYRSVHMKPYYRYNVPQMDILSVETEIWNQHREGHITAATLFNGLKHIQMDYSMKQLSYQAQQLLTIESEETREQYANYVKDSSVPLSNTLITCMATIPRNMSQMSAVDVLIIGTESSIYFVDSQAYTVLHHTTISEAPVKILPIGYYDEEYRIIICTREHDVCVLRKNNKGEFVQYSIYVREYPFDVICCANQLVFATRKRRLIYFSVKGKRQNSVQFDAEITDIEQFYYEPKQYQGVLVAIGNEVRLYVDQFCVDTIRMDLPVEWIKFGKMGREEGVLVISTKGGGLCVKIFRRVAEIPKKSKTFVEQSLRERENPQLLHQIYQRDWFMIKYHTAKTFAELESGKTELLPTRDSEPIQCVFDVLGFGPRFKISVKVITATKLDQRQRWLCFVYNHLEYSMENRVIPVPMLTPNRWFTFSADVVCLNPEKQLQEKMKIVLSRVDWIRPIWMTSFQMPISEANMI